MQDGPIDLIVEAFGDSAKVAAAYRAAATRFETVLDELCCELTFLRQPARVDSSLPEGAVAQRMLEAVRPYSATRFITPMAAVAGAVAEEVLGAMTAAAELSRAYVNDGGDIALHLAPGETFVIGMMERLDLPANPVFPIVGHPSSQYLLFGTSTISCEQPIRGIATSGWRGRSFSLGIADAVTVLANTAAMADAAATIIANAVDLPGHRAIGRARACDLAPDSDLGERRVTQSVAQLSADEIACALAAGACEAAELCGSGLIRSAALNLQGKIRVVGAEMKFTKAPSATRSFLHA